MTTAEKLRNEIASAFPFSEQDFVAFICNGIRREGEASLLCNKDVQGNSLSSDAYTKARIEIKHRMTAFDIAKKHGFAVTTGINYTGEGIIVFTLPYNYN